MPPTDLQAIAGRINTGTADPDTTRALVVFNHADAAQSGVAVFRVQMSWPVETPFPPVLVTDLDGQPVPSALADWQEASDARGRPDHRQISFALRFLVGDVPARGWRTYLAAFVAVPAPNAPAAMAPETPHFTVVETLPHSGDLPHAGTFPQLARV